MTKAGEVLQICGVSDTHTDSRLKVKLADVVRCVDISERNLLGSGLERYVGLEHLDSDDLHITKWGLIVDGTSFVRRFAKGQVLFGKRRAYQRKVAVAQFDGVCSGDILVFEPKGDALLPDLLPFICLSDSFFDHALKTSAGSLSPRTKWKDLAKYEFWLPPKVEQKRMAKLLWAADDLLHKLRCCDTHIVQTQRSLFQTHMRGDRSADSRMVRLLDVCQIQNGQVDPRTSPYAEMIHIASDDIESGSGQILEMNTASQDRVSSGNYKFEETAVLYSKIRPNLRKVALPWFPGVCSADIYPIYAGSEIRREFLAQLLLSDDFTQYAITHSVRSAIPKLNRATLGEYMFRLPSIAQQDRLINATSGLTTLRQHTREHLLGTLNILHNLFSI